MTRTCNWKLCRNPDHVTLDLDDLRERVRRLDAIRDELKALGGHDWFSNSTLNSALSMVTVERDNVLVQVHDAEREATA